jgi:hypothetical protein
MKGGAGGGSQWLISQESSPFSHCPYTHDAQILTPPPPSLPAPILPYFGAHSHCTQKTVLLDDRFKDL